MIDNKKELQNQLNKGGESIINSLIYNKDVIVWRYTNYLTFFRTDPLLCHKFEDIVFFSQETYTHLVSQKTRIIRKLFIFNFFFVKKVEIESCICIVFINESWYNEAYRFLIIELWSLISTFFMKFFSDNTRFLGYKVNITFLTEKIICGTKMGMSYKTASKDYHVGTTNFENVSE